MKSCFHLNLLMLAASLLFAGCGSDSDAPLLGADGGLLHDATGDSTAGDDIAATTTSPQVQVEGGALRGIEVEGADVFLGIPYAAPPVGELRFKPPREAPSWSGVREAGRYGPSCPQTLASRPIGPDELILTEDCLNLNVFTPHQRDPKARLPVLFFIHGGGNMNGSSSESIDYFVRIESGEAIYEGQRVASRGDVVVVTINYRLAALGFLTLPELASESESGSSGNYGLLDQIAALKWVQRNIERFGGDPARVMIFGQSAGAYDTCTLVASPLAKGLFSRAIMHSGICNIHPKERALSTGESLVEELGCADAPDRVACLRALDVDTLVLAQSARPGGIGNFAFYPHVDGHVVDQQPAAVIAAGNHNHVPFIIGSNAHEYANRFVDEVTPEDYPRALAAALGESALSSMPQILAAYPASDYASPREALIAAVTDRNLTCTSRMIARGFAFGQSAPVYRYYFTRVLSSERRAGEGAYHGSELLFLFQHMDGEHFDADADDRSTAAALLGYWTRFAATGDPNGDDLPPWPRYEIATDPYQIVEPTPRSAANLRADKCAFWTNLAQQ